MMDLQDARRAAERIHGVAHRTPVMTCGTLNELAARQLYFKCEQFQKVGAFKFRGAYNAVMKLESVAASKGVVTHSSGNHAQALALSARLRGIPAHIVMPNNAPRVKRQAVIGYGAHVIECEPTLDAREETAAAVQRETHATLVPPYDHPDIIAGQGTVALEVLEQVPNLDAIVAPIGGGGLVSGICVAGHGVNPKLRVFDDEPDGADDAFISNQLVRFVQQQCTKTIADGLLTSLGELTWPIVRDQVERVILVTEEQIRRAMLLLWERAKLLVEPSAAVALAAVLTAEFRALENLHRVGIVLSGGNVDVAQFPLFRDLATVHGQRP
jgi:threonine dehydratase/serine racemase